MAWPLENRHCLAPIPLSEGPTVSATAAGFPAALAELMPDCGLLFKVATPSLPPLPEPELRIGFIDVAPSAAAAELEDPSPFPKEPLFLDEEPDRGDVFTLIDASPQRIEPDCDLDLKLVEAPSSPNAKPDREDIVSIASSSLIEPECDVILNLAEVPPSMLIEPDCEVIRFLAATPSPLLIEPDREVDLKLIDARPSTSSGSLSSCC